MQSTEVGRSPPEYRVERFGIYEGYRLIARQEKFLSAVFEELNRLPSLSRIKLPRDNPFFRRSCQQLNTKARDLAALTDGPYYIRRLYWETVEGVRQAQHELTVSRQARWAQAYQERDRHSCREVSLVSRLDPEGQIEIVETFWEGVTSEGAEARECWLLNLIGAHHFAHLFMEASDSVEKLDHTVTSNLIRLEVHDDIHRKLEKEASNAALTLWYQLKMVEVIGTSIGTWVYENITGEPVTRDADWQNLRDLGIDMATYRRALNPFVWAMEGSLGPPSSSQ